MKKRLMILAVLALVGAGTMTFNYQVFASADVFHNLGVCPEESGSNVVLTNNNSGNIAFSCRGNLSPGPAKVIVLKNTGICDGIGFGTAFTEHFTWHPNGKFTLTCIWK